MFLSSLTLQNFRSYRKRRFDFTKKTTLIVGPNAVGKTNILEALYILATTGSFRAQHDADMVAWNEELGRVSAIEENADKKTLELIVTRGMVQGVRVPNKKYIINGIPRRMIDFIGNITVVLFWPQDLEMVTGSPSIRRNYLNGVLLQTDREYRRSLHSYEKGVRQRNRLLKRIREGLGERNQLLFWNQLLIKTGQYISKMRQAYIEFINDTVWFEDKEHRFTIIYDASPISQERLHSYADAEIAAAVTLVGPHRDDMQFKVKSQKSKVISEEFINLASFGSRGEQRLGVLWVKLAEMGYIEKVLGSRPLLLLDDIFSELDTEHRSIVWQLVDKQQTIITTADPHTIPDTLRTDMNVVELQ